MQPFRPVTLHLGATTPIQAHSVYCPVYSDAVTRVVTHSVSEYQRIYLFPIWWDVAHLRIWLTSPWVLHSLLARIQHQTFFRVPFLDPVHYPGRQTVPFYPFFPDPVIWGCGHKSPMARDT
jgi:hypothetical protein